MKPNIDQVASNGDDNSAAGAKIGQNVITKSSGHERKRTANLESLIGNLKVRKMNVKSDYESSASANGNKKQLNSIYVEVTNNSMSDCCSRSTPPLSSSSPSSSVSPTSSMSPDSPIQSNASSSFSSLSSSSNNASLNSSTNNGNNCKSGGAVHASSRLLPKYEWLGLKKVAENDQENANRIKEENSVGEVDEEDLEEQQPVDLLKCKSDDETDTIKDTMGWTVKGASNNNMMIMDDMDEASGESENEDIDEDEDLLHARQGQTSQVMSSSSSSTASVSKPGKKAAKHVNKNHFNYKIVHADGKSDDAGGSGGRAVKFYDDFIDFRGDILRRPPNSKNCRILWEYLFLLLQDPNYSSVIKWEDESNMVFRIVQAEKLAALWGLQKNRLGMTYEKLSRGMRYYYPNNIIAREPGRRLLYRFMRHPDDIKKFVKKNGTYMLKKTKSTSKGSNPDEMGSPSDDLDDSMNTAELNPDDSGVDEPFNTMNKMSVKKQVANKSANARRKPADEENNDATNNNQDTENNVFSISKNKSFNNNDNDNRNHLKANNNFLSQQQQQQQQAASNPLGLYNDLYLYSAQMAAATYLQNLMSNSGKIDDVNSLLMQQLRSSNNSSSNMNEIANQNLLENNNNNNNSKFPNLNDQVLMYLKYFNNNNNSSTNNNNKSPSANSYSSTHSSSSSSSSSDNNNNSITYASKKFNPNSHHHHNSASSFNESLLEQHNPLNLTMSKSSNSLLMKKAKK